MSGAGKALKYLFIGKITLRNQLAYIADFFVRSLFLLLILYIFLQLWQTTYHGEGSASISGYSFKQLMWYLIVTEAMTIACPSLCTRIEEEVKSGDVTFKLIRPVSFIAFHYVEYISETVVRFAVNAALGGMLGLLAVGVPAFGRGLLWLPVLAVGGFTVNFMMDLVLALCAFWVEETRGLEFVYHKLLFTIGGMLMPLELFPEALQQIGHWLPMQAVLYVPARTAVAFDAAKLPGMLLMQWSWIVILGAAAWLVYQRGVRKLNVNGG